MRARDAVRGIAYSKCGRKLALAADMEVIVCDAETGFVESTLTGHSERVNCVVFSPNGKVIASCSGQGYNRDNSVRLWDAATGAAIGSPLTGHRYVPFPCIECFLSYFGTDLVFLIKPTGDFGRLFALRQVDCKLQCGSPRADLGRSNRGSRWVTPEGALGWGAFRSLQPGGHFACQQLL